MRKICNKCGFQQDEFLNLGGRNYCKSCNSEISVNNKPIKTQEVVTLSAYEKKATLDIFWNTMNWLEKYIEVSGYYHDWDQRKQIHDNRVKRPDANNPETIESLFSAMLYTFRGVVEDDPPYLKEELKQEFYKWINATRIDVNNCPKRLKYNLFGIHEIMEGRNEKIDKDIKNMKKDLDPNSPEYMEQVGKIFSGVQIHLNSQREVAKSLEGKIGKDVESGNMFDANYEQGEKAFGQIAKTVAGSYQNFHHLPQADERSGTRENSQQTVFLGIEQYWSNKIFGNPQSNNNPLSLTNPKIIQDVKNNPKNWRLDEVPTEIDNFSGAVKKQEWLLIRWDARLDDYDQQGKLNFNNNPLYRWESFNSRQRFEIKKALNISVDYLTDEEIKWVIRGFKENPRVWRIGEIDKQIYLIHNSAQIKNNEIGTLIHSRQKFNETKWAEINGALERVKLIDNIKQNTKLERGIVFFDPESGKYSEADDWFVHNEWKNTNEAGCLIFNSQAIIRAKDLSEAEQKEVGYKSETTSHQTQIQQGNRRQGGGGGFGGTTTWGFASVISLIGLAFTR